MILKLKTYVDENDQGYIFFLPRIVNHALTRSKTKVNWTKVKIFCIECPQ